MLKAINTDKYKDDFMHQLITSYQLDENGNKINIEKYWQAKKLHTLAELDNDILLWMQERDLDIKRGV